MNRLLAVDEDRGRLAALASILIALFVYALLARYTGWAAGVKFFISAVAAAAVLGPAVALEPREGPPPGWLSAILVAGFALATAALVTLADVLGADSDNLASGTVTWVALLLALGFGFIALRRDSAVCTLLAAASAVVAVVAAVDWIFSPDGASTFRYIFVLEGLVLAAAGVALYRDRGRHGVVLVALAGVVILVLAASFGASLISFGDGGAEGAGGAWELVILLFGFGLAVFAAHTREPGPGYVSAALLLAFVVLQTGGAEEKFLWWPLLLLLGAGGAVAAFLAGPRGTAPGGGTAPPAETTREVRL
ncbi:MAG TPA: hypothetical protein VF549_06160 [Solirubrobacteraceae bacterium]|jgi:hypothetical protein